MARKRSIISFRKEYPLLKEITDEEIDVFRKSVKYEKNLTFKEALDAEYLYRLKKKAEEK